LRDETGILVGEDGDARRGTGGVSRPRLLVFIIAYYAEATLRKVIDRIPRSVFSDYDAEVLVVDDASDDATFAVGNEYRSEHAEVPLTVLRNRYNQGYGGNQKIGYAYALRNEFDFVALVHGDGQYAPEELPRLLAPLRSGSADAVFGSRFLPRRGALRGGMPPYKFVGNRILTTFQNAVLGTRFSEFHSGYRLYSRRALEQIPFRLNSNDFHFDTEIIIQLLNAHMRIVELPIPTYYGDEISRVNGMQYAWNVTVATLRNVAHRMGLLWQRRFEPLGGQNRHYELKLGYASSHQWAIDAVRPGESVLDIGSGPGGLAAELVRRGCRVAVVDRFPPSEAPKEVEVFVQDLDDPPAFDVGPHGTLLLLDIVEHLRDPELFLERLRAAFGHEAKRVVLTSPNVAFLVPRLMLLFGQFNYGMAGTLDRTHTRLFTFRALRHLLQDEGFVIHEIRGIPAPFPKALGDGWLARLLLRINLALIRVSRSLFSYQIFVVAESTPSVEFLLDDAEKARGEGEVLCLERPADTSVVPSDRRVEEPREAPPEDADVSRNLTAELSAPGAAFRGRRSFLPFRGHARLIAFSTFFALTVLFTYPLIVSPAKTIEWGGGDPLLNAYLLNWGQHALITQPTRLFNASFYFPSQNTLSLSDHLISVSWPLLPLALTGKPLLVYNASVFLAFCLSAFMFFLYLRRIGVGDAAAWLGGLLFGFFPWRYGQLGHAQLNYTWWIPCTLLAFESWLANRSRLSAAAIGAGFAAVFLASIYHGIFFGVFLCTYGSVRLLAERRALAARGFRVLALDAAAACATAGMLLAPSLIAYRRMALQLVNVNPLASLADRGADVLDYLNPSGLSLVWSSFSRLTHPYSDIPWEMHAFPGALALLAFVIAPLALLRASEPETKPLRARASLAIWLGGIALFAVSLGPTVHFANHIAPFPGLYSLLYRWLPGFSAMRVPVRASFYVGMAGAALAAIFAERLARGRGGKTRSVVMGGLIALALLDVFPRRLPYQPPEEYLRLRAAMQKSLADAGPGVDLVLPITDRLNYAAPLASVGPFRPILNGKSGYLLRRNGLIFDLFTDRPFTLSHVEGLRALGVSRILVDRRQMDTAEFGQLVDILGRYASNVRLVSTVEDISVLSVRW
jgi:glycosyltransferase involved in cell wall biosynthesis